jgi:hypothetical protein
MTQTVQQWLAAMPPTKFDQPGRGSPGAFDIGRRGHDEDVPELKQAAAPMPRTEKPAHITTAQGDDDDDEIDLDKLVKRLLDACAEHDIPISTLSLEEAAEQLLGRTAHERGDAGPTRQAMVDDEEPPDDEIDRVMEHIVRSPEAASRLLEKLRASDLPPGLRDKASRDQLERQIEHLDPASACDAAEAIRAVELMRQRGNLERGVGERMAERRGTEAWHPGAGEPPGTDLPRAAGKQHSPGSLVPPTSRPKPFTASDAALARVKPRAFHKVIGVKKRHLPGVL